MANRTFSRVQALNHDVKVISGRIPLPLGNDDPNDSNNNADTGDDQLTRNPDPISGLGFFATSVGGTTNPAPVAEDAGNCKIYLGAKELAKDPTTQDVTLDKIKSDRYMDLISSSGSVLLDDGRSGVVSFISEDVANAATVNLRVSQTSDGAAVALQGEASGEIQFTLVLRNSSADKR